MLSWQKSPSGMGVGGWGGERGIFWTTTRQNGWRYCEGGGGFEQTLVSYGEDYDDSMYFSISLLELLVFFCLFFFLPWTKLITAVLSNPSGAGSGGASMSLKLLMDGREWAGGLSRRWAKLHFSLSFSLFVIKCKKKKKSLMMGRRWCIFLYSVSTV